MRPTTSGIQPSFGVAYKVTYKVYLLYNASQSFSANSNPIIKLQLQNATGQNRSAPGISVTALRVSPRGNINTTVKTLAGNFVFDSTISFSGAAPGGGYKYALDLTGVPAGQQYDLVFSVAGDPILHTAPFEVMPVRGRR